MVVSVTRQTANQRAERMGRRAGEALARLGIPSRCPFRRPELVSAWARGYVAGAGAGAGE